MGGPDLSRRSASEMNLTAEGRGGQVPLLRAVLAELAVGALQVAPVFEGELEAGAQGGIGVELVPLAAARVEPGEGEDALHDARVIGMELGSAAPHGDVDEAAIGALGFDAVGDARQISEVVGHVEVGIGEVGGFQFRRVEGRDFGHGAAGGGSQPGRSQQLRGSRGHQELSAIHHDLDPFS